MRKTVSALDGSIDTFLAMRDSIIGGPDNVQGRHDAFRDELDGGIIVDTVAAYDTNTWETGIFRGNKWFIVEQYEDREHAATGHAQWVEKLIANPAAPLPSLMLWE